MVDVQKLMDMDGAGKAEEEVRRLGYWDESNVDESQFDGKRLFEFRFMVRGYYEPEVESRTMTILDYNLEDAERQAEDIVDFDELESIDLMKILEVE